MVLMGSGIRDGQNQLYNQVRVDQNSESNYINPMGQISFVNLNNTGIGFIDNNHDSFTQSKASVDLVVENCQVNCEPNVSATFSNDNLSVTATSTKDLSNVVIKFCDGTEFKFDKFSAYLKLSQELVPMQIIDGSD